MVKLDGMTGEVLWSSGYASPEGISESAYALALDAAGNAYITGRAHILLYRFDIITAKFDADDGEMLWMVTRGTTEQLDDIAWDIVITTDGHPVITGRFGNLDGTADFYTAKLNQLDGSTMWERQLPGAVSNEAQAGWLVRMPGGDVVMCNRTWTASTNYDVVLHRYGGTDGATVWKYQWGSGPGKLDDPRNMSLDADGSLLVCGVSDGDYMVLKIDPSTGQPIWTASYDGPPGWYDVANCIMPGPNNSVLVSGYSNGTTTGWDFATCALNSITGEEMWVERFDNGSGYSDEAMALATNVMGDVFVVGYGYTPTTNNDLLTVCYHVDIATPVEETPVVAATLRAYPNPFNPLVHLSFSLDQPGPVRVAIYDTRGRCLKVLRDGDVAKGEQRVSWDGTDRTGRSAPAGVYLATVRTSEYETTRKVVLAK